MSTLRIVAFVVLLAGIPARGVAQVVIGQLRGADDLQPLPNTLVVLVDPSGRQRARTVTNAQGHFILRAPARGDYQLEAQRIGYETAASPRLTLDRDTLRYVFDIRVQPVALPEIEATTGERGCERRPDGAEVARLWNEIRKVLQVTEWTERFGDMRYTSHTYRVLVDSVERLLVDADGSTTITRGALPFGAPALSSELSEHGFTRPNGEGRFFLGPDAAVLTSDEFLDEHCFRLVMNRQSPEFVGLGFEPLRRRRGIADISGTLWVDRRSAALDRLEYSYTNLPAPFARFGAHAETKFARLENDLWIVQSWWIRSARVTASTYSRGDVQSSGFAEDGGRVLRAEAGRQALYQFDADAVVEGVVRRGFGDDPLVGAHVFLIGIGAGAITDAAGHYRIADVPAGRYGLSFSHELVRDLDQPVALDSIVLTSGDTVRRDLALPPFDEMMGRLCPTVRAEHETPGFLYGFVTDTTGAPVADARVRAFWQGGIAEHFRRAAPSDANGRYVVCWLPIDTVITVEITHAGNRRTRFARIPERGYQVLPLQVR